MRSDLRDNSETISKMIQFGTVKYGIVKQLKDRTRSERDIISEQDEAPSMPCSPVAECKVYSPESHTNAANDDENADHNHNNNNNSTDNHDEEMHFPSADLKGEMPEPYTYPEVELRKSPSPITQIPPAGPSPTINDCDRDHLSDDHNMSENEHDQERELEIPNINDEACKAILDEAAAAAAEDAQQRHLQNHQQNSNSRSSPPPTLPQFPAAPITIDVIQNMQMAIAQFAAKTLANGGTNNEAAMKQLAFLQQTLFNLQQQQIFQMQLIQQLQSQLAINQIKGENQEHNEEDEEVDEDEQLCAENLSNHKSDDEFEERHKDSDAMDLASQDTMMSHRRLSEEEKEAENSMGERNHKVSERSEDEKAEDSEECDKNTGSHLQSLASLHHNNNNNNNNNSSNMNGQSLDKTDILPSLSSKLDENTPLPYASDLASSIITNHDDPPSLDEPNSLEMLQKRAQEVLESASQGILAGNLADEFAFGKDKNGDCKNRNEPFFKHRCRYCGKVFGSDSALQIHIRSHTGERPFKCNVCGSRFTTKGNLKVHFQRHSQKFPHVPMNCTPIPEHLDKFHPPLLEQMSPEASPPHQPQMPPVPNVPVSLPLPFPPTAGFPGLPLYRPPLEILKSLGHYPTPFFGGLPPMPPAPLKRDQDAPTDLRKPSIENLQPEKQEIKEEPLSLRIKEERRDSEREDSMPRDNQPTRRPPSPDMPLIPPPLPLANLPISSPLERSQEVVLPPEAKRSKSETPPLSIPQPPPLPASILQTSPTLLQQSIVPPPHQSPLPAQQQLPPTTTQLPSLIKREDFSQRLPLNYTKLSPDRRSPIRSPASIPRSPFLGPIKHEMTLLPRPHSNDNSWENFIEVSNTSETVKLKELMKNKKLTDPNQCVVCDRVLSCKSALQMHYRTHTGERPFKCRICGRAFTTKGNLKTHMAVHKIRPPMRNFHQCPVCHKKYSNALVLQQHIRLHTGEPTDLTPEQIQAAEIRDFPPTIMPGSFLNPFTFNFGLGGGGGGHHNGMIGSESSQGENEEGMDCSDDFDDDMSENLSNGGFSDRPKSSDDMKGMLFEQKLKIENNRPKSEASTSSAPTSPVSAINKSSPTPSDTSQGALDLTPRSSMPPHTPPNHGPPIFHARPPFGMFPNLPLFPPVSSTAQNMCSAMNSIAQSVMPSAPFNPLALSGVRGSTTCGICFKTFPCHSALEIHYRSHTKERPFKCSICDRGFTTKGNLKQHMLTHKIRDMEQDAFRNRAIKYSTEQEQR